MQQVRRGLRAVFAAALLAAALIVGALPGIAHAAAGDTWYVTANLYCPAAYTPPGIDVYLTNSANPIEGTGMPSSGITEATALLTDNGDGTYTLVVQVTNLALTLQSLGSGDGAVSVVGFTTSSDLVWWDESAEHEVSSRIVSVTFSLTGLESTYTISGCTIYATPLSMSFTSPVILVVDLSGVELDASEEETVEEESEGAEAEAEDEDEAVSATEDEAATESESDEDAVADNDGGDDATANDAAAEVETDASAAEPATGDSDGGTDAATETESAGATSESPDDSAVVVTADEVAAADDAAGTPDDDASDNDVVADEEPAARQATALALARLQQLAERLESFGTAQLGCALENALKG